jgi:ribosomal protein L11
MMDKDIKYIKKCFLMSQKAEAVPPLGTILGNIGVNTIKFCDEFNIFTKELSNYFSLRVIIYIYENKTFKFFINKPSSAHLMNLLKFDRKIKVLIKNTLQEKILYCIKLKDLIQIAIFKFPKKNLEKSIPIILGTAKSIGLYIV